LADLGNTCGIAHTLRAELRASKAPGGLQEENLRKNEIKGQHKWVS
jgi:hypothetical protein